MKQVILVCQAEQKKRSRGREWRSSQKNCAEPKLREEDPTRKKGLFRYETCHIFEKVFIHTHQLSDFQTVLGQFVDILMQFSGRVLALVRVRAALVLGREEEEEEEWESGFALHCLLSHRSMFYAQYVYRSIVALLSAQRRGRMDGANES